MMPFAPRLQTAFETANQIDFTDFDEGDDDLLLRRVCHLHLVIGRHCRLFMWAEHSSRDFRGMRLVELGSPQCGLFAGPD